MSDLYRLTEEQMARLRPYFPKSHGKPRVDDRRVLSGIVFVNRNGLGWRFAFWTRFRTHSQKNTVAARAMADKKTVGHLS